MSRPAKKVLNLRPVFGLEATVTTPATATDGAPVEMDIVLEPNGHTNVHYHPEQGRDLRGSRRYLGGPA